MEIARLAASDITNSDIGRQLFIFKNTVKMALKSIYSKLCINSRAFLEQHLNSMEK
jgi:DNA-binding NarL/FixJ family response regulator